LEIDVAGFSQGAAMAFSLALLHPERISRVAALSGFLPEGSEERLAALQGKKIFIAHGREDEVIPVEFARQAKAMLEAHGTEVTYCESEGGHKVGKQCLKGMETFLIIG